MGTKIPKYIDRGRITINRKIIDNVVYSDSEWLHVWLDILLHSNWKCRKIIVDNSPKMIHAGEQITSQVKLSKRTGVERNKIRRILNGLKSEQQLEHQTSNRFTFIKVLNWFQYQYSEQQFEHLCSNCTATVQQLLSTTNKDKKDIKDKKDNKKKKIATPKVVADNPINSLIDKFKDINPSYEKFFANKTQRAALERLVAKLGEDKAIRSIDACVKIYGMKYAPRITTPVQLENKLGELIAFYKSDVNGKKGGMVDARHVI